MTTLRCPGCRTQRDKLLQCPNCTIDPVDGPFVVSCAAELVSGKRAGEECGAPVLAILWEPMRCGRHAKKPSSTTKYAAALTAGLFFGGHRN